MPFHKLVQIALVSMVVGFLAVAFGHPFLALLPLITFILAVVAWVLSLLVPRRDDNEFDD